MTATTMLAITLHIMTMTATMTRTVITTATRIGIMTAIRTGITTATTSGRRVGARARKRDGGIAICLPARRKNRAVTEIMTVTTARFITGMVTTIATTTNATQATATMTATTSEGSFHLLQVPTPPMLARAIHTAAGFLIRTTTRSNDDLLEALCERGL